MPIVAFDLEDQIESLRGLKGDLDEHYWSAGPELDEGIRYGLGIASGQLAQRIATLEDVHRRFGTKLLCVKRLGLDEQHRIERALGVLDLELAFDPAEAESKIWAHVRDVLAAADELLLASVRAVADVPDAVPEEPRRAVVLSLRQAR